MAQKKVDKTTPYTAGKEVYLNLRYASDIRIKVWDKNEVSVSALVNINNNADNDNFELDATTTDAQLQIRGIVKNLKHIVQIEQNVEQDGKSGIYYGGGGYWDDENKVYISSGPQVFVDIDYEIYVPAQANVSLKTISGDVAVEYQKGKYKLETISGKIDLQTTSSNQCNFSVQTISGDVYTNLALDRPKSEAGELSRVGGKFESDLKLNKGGEKITLKTISGNIYLRKK